MLLLSLQSQWEKQPRSATESTLKKSLRQLNGGARHLVADLRARKSFEHVGCSKRVFSASLALPVLSSVELRRMCTEASIRILPMRSGGFSGREGINWPPGKCDLRVDVAV